MVLNPEQNPGFFFKNTPIVLIRSSWFPRILLCIARDDLRMAMFALMLAIL